MLFVLHYKLYHCFFCSDLLYLFNYLKLYDRFKPPEHVYMFIYPVFVPLFFRFPPTEGLVLSSDQLKGRLEFHDVSFAYPTRKEAPIFQNLSLLVPAGTIMAVVGPSGSGKSTLVSLLLRLYDPDAGESDPTLSII